MGIIKEFKTFVMRGNVTDLAVGIIIGSAFSKIVTSLVEDIIMPPIGALIGGINFTSIRIPLKQEVTDVAGKIIQEGVYLRIGNFIQFVFDFIVIAAAVFMFIKVINRLQLKKEAEQKASQEPTKQETLLTEIRDLLKGEKKS
jgi:large conductance mechanosensitive channel